VGGLGRRLRSEKKAKEKERKRGKKKVGQK
jgi:hypothetical protein